MANAGRVLFANPVERERLGQLMSALQEMHPVVADAFTVAVGTTLRMGDVLSLTDENCKWLESDDVLVLREQKTEKARRVMVHPKAKAVLLNRMGSGLIFRGLRGPITVSWVNRVLKMAGDRIGMRREDMKSHIARKSSARAMYEAGTPLPIICEMLGHSSERMTLRYLGIQTQEMKKAIEAVPL